MSLRYLLTGAAVGAVVAVTHKHVRNFIRRRMCRVKLTYFDVDGLGEPIRYVLAIAGVPFEDYRFADREEFVALKPSLRFGQVPCLTVDGDELFQSAAVMRFVATFFGSTLYPSDTKAAALVDSLIDQIKDMDIGKMVALYKGRFGLPETVLNDGNAEKVFELWRSETLPRHLSFLEATTNASPTMWLAGTSDPTIADIFLATQLQGYRRKWPALPPFALKLQAIIDAVYSLPAVVNFQAANALKRKAV